MSDELDPMWSRVSTIMGEHTCKEIIEGVWEHTFTPAQRPSGSLEAAEVYLQPAIEQMEQRRIKWLEKYQQWSKESLFKRMEEMSKPMSMMDYLQYCYPTIEIQPVRFHPYLATGTVPGHWENPPLDPIACRYLRDKKARQRARRQHRAAFRRRKRGLA